VARLKALPDPILVMRERCVIHHQTSPQAVKDFIDCVTAMKAEKEAGGHPEKDQTNDYMLEEGKLRRQAALGY
jgi:threonine aldolase